MKSSKLCLALALGLTLVSTGCSNDSNEQKTSAKPEEQQSAKPLQMGQTAQAKADNALSGTITETFESGGYTYILLDNGHNKIWAAIAATKVEVGQKIALANGPVMKDFRSRSLDRIFPEIVFSSGIKGAEKSGHGLMGSGESKKKTDAGNNEANFMAALGKDSTTGQTVDPAKASGGSSKAIVNAVEIKIDKATGTNGYTVEEIFAKAKELNGQKVLIQAKVVKISPQIMGKNWLHLQDGSGNAMHNTHDLVMTTSETPELDSVVTLEGVVAADKDFGAGYFYAVIVEEGTIKK